LAKAQVGLVTHQVEQAAKVINWVARRAARKVARKVAERGIGFAEEGIAPLRPLWHRPTLVDMTAWKPPPPAPKKPGSALFKILGLEQPSVEPEERRA
jgi:hypothetical protein